MSLGWHWSFPVENTDIFGQEQSRQNKALLICWWLHILIILAFGRWMVNSWQSGRVWCHLRLDLSRMLWYERNESRLFHLSASLLSIEWFVAEWKHTWIYIEINMCEYFFFSILLTHVQHSHLLIYAVFCNITQGHTSYSCHYNVCSHFYIIPALQDVLNLDPCTEWFFIYSCTTQGMCYFLF